MEGVHFHNVLLKTKNGTGSDNPVQAHFPVLSACEYVTLLASVSYLSLRICPFESNYKIEYRSNHLI